MEAKKSLMKLTEIQVFESQVQLILPKQESDPVDFGSYSIGIDFEIKTSEDDSAYAIFCSIVVNDEKKTGYYLKVVGACAFCFEDTVDKDEREQMLFYSGVSICISNLRSYFVNITSYNSIFPKYILPAIDMNHLLETKSAIDTEANSESENK